MAGRGACAWWGQQGRAGLGAALGEGDGWRGAQWGQRLLGRGGAHGQGLGLGGRRGRARLEVAGHASSLPLMRQQGLTTGQGVCVGLPASAT